MIRFAREHGLRCGLALLAGVLFAIALPKFELAGASWIAPGVLLLATLGAPPGLRFRIGFIAGFAQQLIVLYWLLYIPVAFMPIVGWIAMSAYLGLFAAAWACACWSFFPARAALPATKSPFDAALASAFRSTSWNGRALWCLRAAALWAALEWLMGWLFSGFPWNFIGVAQYQMLPLVQIASATGVYGVSFLVIWFSCALLCAGFALTQYPPVRNAWMREMILPLTTVVIVAVSGLAHIRRQAATGEPVKIALVQPAIPQTVIWEESESTNRFQKLLELSERALTEKPDLLVWPEASVPNMVRHHEDTGRAIRELVERHGVWAIIGSDDAEYRAGTARREVDYFNSAFAVSPDGTLSAGYRKRRLVMFGEYIPFVRTIPFLKHLSPVGEGFTPGTVLAEFDLGALNVRTAPLICFEDTFGSLVREYVKPDTDFLINITNNGWFGEGAAQWQHAATAAFRAIENRIPLVRCGNNGLSCWVDPVGRFHGLPTNPKDVYAEGYRIVNVPRLATPRTPTFYTRYGDVFAWSCAGYAGLALVRPIRTWARTRRQSSQPQNGRE